MNFPVRQFQNTNNFHPNFRPHQHTDQRIGGLGLGLGLIGGLALGNIFNNPWGYGYYSPYYYQTPYYYPYYYSYPYYPYYSFPYIR